MFSRFRASAFADFVVSLSVAITTAFLLGVSIPAQADLARVGPTQLPSPPGNGYPLWYQDLNGTVLDLCMPNAEDPGQLQAQACLLVPGGLNPPYAFPNNYPDEGFYFNATAIMDMPNGTRATLVLALEAAFAGGPVVPGDQVVFTRIRIVSGVPFDGNYRVTHPYGTDTFNGVTSNGANRDIVFTEDVGFVTGIFTGALKSRVGPFLKPADTLGNPLPPVTINGAQFLTDGLTTVPVTGSPYGTNYFEICGPMNGPTLPESCVRTNQFSIIGRVHDHVANPIGSPATIERAVYSRDASIAHVDVVANAIAGVGQATPRLSVAGTGLPSVLMNGPNAVGNFYAQSVPVSGNALPRTVTVTNFADSPSSTITAPVVDDVIVTSAIFEPAVTDTTDGNVQGTLTVIATSSDKGTATDAVPTLRLEGNFSSLEATTGVVSGDPASVMFRAPAVKVIPSTVTVLSSVGGRGSRSVSTALSPVAFAAGTPLALDDSVAAEAGDTVPTVIPVLANDTANPAAPINPATVAIVAPISPAGMGSLAVNVDGSVSYTPPATTAGTATFKYTVANAVGPSNVATVTLNVAPPPFSVPVPIANNDPDVGGTISVGAGQSVNINVLANDSGNGGTLNPASVAISTPPSSGTAGVDTATGRIIYTAPADAATSVVSFTYSVANTNGNVSSPATVTVNVNAAQPPAPNPSPIANNDPSAGGTISVASGQSVAINVLANDNGNGGTLNPASVVIVSPPTAGSAAVDTITGAINYTSPANITEPLTVTMAYTVANTNGQVSAPATVTVNVSPVETFTAVRGRCKVSTRTWDVRGTSNLVANNSVTIYVTPTVPDVPTPDQILGTALIDATGTFQFASKGVTACTSPISWKTQKGTNVNNVTVNLN